MTEEYFYNAVDLLQQIIKIPSFSREEDEVANLIAMELEKENFIPNRVGNNVWAISHGFDTNKPTILLNSHIDTVKPVSGWTINPYGGDIDNAKLYGLGSNDAGGSLVSLLQTFFYFNKYPTNDFNLVFLASCQEEISGREGAELALKSLPKIDIGIVGEPTLMNPAIAEKGLMVIDAIAKGKAGHAARTEGDNAIYKALKDIEWVKNYKFSKSSETLGDVKMTVTMIEAGTQHNVIPDVCSFVIDVRSNELYSNLEILEIINQNTLSETKARSTRLNSSKIDQNHPIIKRLQMLGKKPYGSPTLSDQTVMNFETVKLGPGDSARSHTADEFIYLSEIREAIDIYINILTNLNIKQ